MWLKRLVGVMMIVTCLSMITLAIVGVFSAEKRVDVGFETSASQVVEPTVTLTAKPGTISVGGYSALTWTSGNNPETCTASGSWKGAKTQVGAESTGRVTKSGTKTYTLTCQNEAGKSVASVKIKVKKASDSSGGSGAAAVSTAGKTYCNGRSQCYGRSDVAKHNSKGNCWGWNGDRVINISGFDLAFHVAQTGVSSIEVSQVCGHDLAPALNGSVSASGHAGQNHKATTKANNDSNEQPYFVGWFDGSK
ncbi:hypothetical protein KDA23_07260 [Candidatus Saccharibacteria bacterium]|nr:hypothetical protein [Candidatus Saccharibacteria bacterium]